MPDWTYRPLVRPLARSELRFARVMRAFGALGRSDPGARLVAWFGASTPPRPLRRDVAGLVLRSPVGVSPAPADPAGSATRAITALGAGLVDLGPVSAPGFRNALRQAQPSRGSAVPVLVVAERPEQVEELRGFVDLVEVPPEAAVVAAVVRIGAVPLLGLRAGGPTPPTDGPGDAGEAVTGVVVRGRHDDALALVRTLPAPTGAVVVAADTADVPDALDLLAAGADVVCVGEGLLTSGPALPARVADALMDRLGSAARDQLGERTAPGPRLVRHPLDWPGWVWVALLGAAMVGGGIVAAVITLGPVLLPYDRDFLGVDAAGLLEINPQLVAFLQHDRITLAGTMVSIGLLYSGLAWGGMRQGRRWAWWVSNAVSATGFPTYFLFLGFGFFDPLHGLFALALAPLAVLAARAPAPPRAPAAPEGADDAVRSRALVGQLLVVVVGVGLAVGALVIMVVGISNVFVPADLDFLHAHRHELDRANPQLLAFTAHDRAGFGGALFCDAVGVVLLGMWGWRRGQAWVWWTLATSGAAGFVPAVAVHLAVGYTDWFHLVPVVVAALLLVLALVLAGPYLLRPTRPAVGGRTPAAASAAGSG